MMAKRLGEGWIRERRIVGQEKVMVWEGGEGNLSHNSFTPLDIYEYE